MWFLRNFLQNAQIYKIFIALTLILPLPAPHNEIASPRFSIGARNDICVHLCTAGNACIASWYGGGEKLNKHTANMEVFDPNKLTCASWDYPFGAKLKVTNLKNGESVIVRVNDRGPNKRLGRAIDLTKHAFSEISDTEKGLITVKIQKLH